MVETTHEQSKETASRATQLFLAAVIGMAFVGFIVGIRQGVPTNEPPEFAAPASDHREPGAVTSTSYSDFDRRRVGPNREWRSILASLERPEIDLFGDVRFDEDERRQLIADRARRRAFDGAPPVVPHPIDQMTSTSCKACHETGVFIGEMYAPPISHEFLNNCTQCHVEQWSVDLAKAPAVRTSFEGLESPGRGGRAWLGAPPTVPHPTFMRENCLACHGPTSPDPIRTSHPWRTNCLQCHAPSVSLDQRVADDPPAFLPPPPVAQP